MEGACVSDGLVQTKKSTGTNFISSPQPINLFHLSHLVELGHGGLDHVLILLLMGLLLIRVGDLLVDSSSMPPAVGCEAWWRKGVLDTKSETMLLKKYHGSNFEQENVHMI